MQEAGAKVRSALCPWEVTLAGNCLDHSIYLGNICTGDPRRTGVRGFAHADRPTTEAQ